MSSGRWPRVTAPAATPASGEREVRAGEAAGGDLARDQVHRRVAEEARDEDVARPVVDLERRADLLQHALCHHRDAVGEGHRLDLVVGDVDGGDADLALQVLDLRPHLHPELGVEVGERLVHQEELRRAHDGAAERHPLALAAGERRRAAVEEVAELDPLGGRRAPGARALVARHAGRP